MKKKESYKGKKMSISVIESLMNIYTYEVGYKIKEIKADYMGTKTIEQTYRNIKAESKIEAVKILIKMFPAKITEIVYVSKKSC